ncbi:MAG: hypothetical protein IT221_15805 [Fluviicola sp.]|nr:hypothetical protein [Fluviicola sp.]
MVISFTLYVPGVKTGWKEDAVVTTAFKPHVGVPQPPQLAAVFADVELAPPVQ